jgi:hypothetical protein
MAETTTQVQTNIPDYIRPYVESQLGRVSALTDINQNPYQSYTGQRIAQASPLQQQSYGMAAGMSPSSQTMNAGVQANNIFQQAGQAGQYTPNTNFQALGPMMTGTQNWNGAAAQNYMNPYMQGVVDIQKREAMRQSDILGQGQNAQAVGAGAFGGSRNAIVEAERQRNLSQQMNDIQAQGANAAWQQAMGMFTSDQARNLQSQLGNQGAWGQYGAQNLQAQGMGEASRQFGSNLGLQGLQQQLAAAGLMKDVGQSAYNQQVGIAGLQNQFGTQQQVTNQAGLDSLYQDFQNRQAWPYKNEEFMYNLMRGLPMQNTTSTLNTPAPSPISQMAGVGTALYGMSQLGKKKGGSVKTKKYANGGLADLLISTIA